MTNYVLSELYGGWKGLSGSNVDDRITLKGSQV